MTAGLLLLIAIVAALAAPLWLGLQRNATVRLFPVGLISLTAPLDIYRTNLGPMNLSVFRLALILAVLITIVDVGKHRHLRPPISLPLALYAGLIVLQLLSLLFVTANTTLGYRFLLQYVAGLAAVAVILYWARPADLALLVALFLVGSVLPTIGAAWRVFSVAAGAHGSLPGIDLLPVNPGVAAARGIADYLTDGTQRMQSTFSDPNHFGFLAASFLSVGMGALVFLWMRRDVLRYRRLIVPAGGLVASQAVVLIGSYSRSAWLAAAIGLGVLGALLGKASWSNFISRRATIIGAVVVGAALVLVVPIVAARVNPSDFGNAASNAEHARTVRIAARLAIHHPITGVGLAGYGRYADEPAFASSAHSTYLTTAAELGFPGLVVLLAAISSTALYGIRQARSISDTAQRMLVAGCVAAYLGLVAGNILYDVWMDDFQWILFGLVLVAAHPPRVRVTLRIPRTRIGLLSLTERRV